MFACVYVVSTLRQDDGLMSIKDDWSPSLENQYIAFPTNHPYPCI